MKFFKKGTKPYLLRIVVSPVLALIVSISCFSLPTSYAYYQDELGDNVFGITSIGQPQSIVLQSPGFEDGSSATAWTTGGGSQYNFALDNMAGRNGGTAATIESPAGTAPGFPFYSQDLTGWSVGMPIEFGAWIRTEVEDTSPAGAYLAVSYYDSSGSRIAFDQSSALKGSMDWTYVKAVGIVPQGAVTVKVRFLLNGTGKAYYDDANVSVYPQADVPQAVYASQVQLNVAGSPSNSDLLGFGTEINPFTFAYDGLTAADKQMIFDRLSEIRPAWVRVFVDTSWWVTDTGYDFTSTMASALLEDLQMCNDLGAKVNLVMWEPTELRTSAIIADQMSALLLWLQSQAVNVAALTLYNEPDHVYPGTSTEYVDMYDVMKQSLQTNNLTQIELIGGDVGANDGYLDMVAPQLNTNVEMLSYHQYVPYKKSLLKPVFRAALAAKTAADNGIPDMYGWESNLTGGQGAGGGFSPGVDSVDGKLLPDRFSSVLKLSSYMLQALASGVKGLSYWEAFEMSYSPDPNDLNWIMHFGMWSHKTDDFTLRPAYYGFQLLSGFIDPGASITSLTDASANHTLLSYMVDNPDGTHVVYLVNPWDQPVEATVDFGNACYSSANAKQYVFEASAVADAIGAEQLSLDESAVTFDNGLLIDTLPAESMAVILLDDQPPVTTATAARKEGAHEGESKTVKVEFHADDGAHGFGVKQIQYSLGHGWTTVADEEDTVYVKTRKNVLNIRYRSIDHAGNVENVKRLIVKVDKLPSAYED
ncbi:hypothetical protein [Paenibacillus sp. HB172176]|uniref:hypothetical protein n=1 Tax=Paenibacillus sp. HB172176 TaxID=2493690 RepID=UPI0014398C1A|nr:hypothetical protein [Paenibacillus sp. HB172176]